MVLVDKRNCAAAKESEDVDDLHRRRILYLLLLHSGKLSRELRICDWHGPNDVLMRGRDEGRAQLMQQAMMVTFWRVVPLRCVNRFCNGQLHNPNEH